LFPRTTRFRSGDLGGTDATVLRITGKGGKTWLVPVLPVALQAVLEYRRLCPWHLGADDPLFRGARGGPLNPAIIQREMARLRSALRSEEHTSELQSRENLVCRLLLEKKKKSNQDTR